MTARIREQLIIVLAAGIVLFANLGGPRLWDDDEPRNAGCAAEMQARGDWVVPVFNGELRTHKPALLYWLMMSAYQVFGVSEFAARFWSAALGIGTVLMTYHLGRRLFDDSAGFWAALALAPALMFGVAGRAATPDAVLMFCSTLAIYLYVRFSWNETLLFPARWWQAALVYAAMGLGVLAKGPVGFVLPTAVIGMFLLILRLPASEQTSRVRSALRPFAPLHFARTAWSMRPVTAILTILAVSAGWYAWVHVRTDGVWTAGFFWEHNFGRATSVMEGHRGNVLFYPLALLVGFFPWSVFAAPVVIDAVQQIRRRAEWTPGYVFAACWVCVYVTIFSLAKTKLPSYITPCYPAVALLTGALISRVGAAPWPAIERWLRVAMGAIVLIGAGLVIGLRLAVESFLPGEEQLALIGLVPLVMGLWGISLIAQRQFREMAGVFAAGGVAFSTLLFAVVAQRVDGHQEADRLLTEIARQSEHPQIGYFRTLEPSWVFYSGHELATVTTPNDPARLESEWTLDAATRRWTRLPKREAREFFGNGRKDSFVITTRADWTELQASVPAGVEVLAEVPYFLKKNHHLVLVGRRDAKTARAAQDSSIKRR